MSEGRRRAWAGTILFLFLAPGIVAGVVPWLLTRWTSAWPDGGIPWPLAAVAVAAIVCGMAVLLDAFVRFARAGGTPAPPAPTRELVVVGPYRYVRNPMYLAVLAIILGQALLFGSASTLVYAAIVFVTVLAFVKAYEEPTLEREYGDQYREYRRDVPGWMPRPRPWKRG